MIWPYSTAISKRSSPIKPDAVAQTRKGIKTIPKPVPIKSTKVRPLIASSTNLSAFFPRLRRFEYKGTKAELKAPSAKNLLNMFGRRNATINASKTGPTPIKAKSKISRAIPKIRLISVQKPTVKIF